jgi:manganese-transporting P-type ATPase
MIDFRSARVDADSPETLYILLALSAVSLASSASVVLHGLRDPTRSPLSLLLECLRLISRGVPFYLLDVLTDKVSLAVQALQMRAHVVCTEPFRLPMAGNVDTCLFDKTGTLTTEHLLIRGVLDKAWTPPVVSTNGSLPLSGGNSSGSPPLSLSGAEVAKALRPVTGRCPESLMVLAACHSLVELDGSLAGDSLEVSYHSGSL